MYFACTTVLYPSSDPGEYVLIVFVPGLFGTSPPDLYTDTLKRLAGHRYVVIAMDTVISLDVDDKLRKESTCNESL